MHTDIRSKTTFNYNSDLSGDVVITNFTNDESIKIPMEDLLNFIGSCVIDNKISELENTKCIDVLGIKL